MSDRRRRRPRALRRRFVPLNDEVLSGRQTLAGRVIDGNARRIRPRRRKRRARRDVRRARGSGRRGVVLPLWAPVRSGRLVVFAHLGGPSILLTKSLPSIEVRSEDRPLHEDMRYLAGVLGRVVERLQGPETFRAVEDLRTASRDRRRGDTNAETLEQMLEKVDALPLAIAAPVARAFTLFFFLINTAEQVHRIRRRRAYEQHGTSSTQPGSLHWAFQKLVSEGRTAADIREVLSELEVRPVLTAHPRSEERRVGKECRSRWSAYD